MVCVICWDGKDDNGQENHFRLLNITVQVPKAIQCLVGTFPGLPAPFPLIPSINLRKTEAPQRKKLRQRKDYAFKVKDNKWQNQEWSPNRFFF